MLIRNVSVSRGKELLITTSHVRVQMHTYHYLICTTLHKPLVFTANECYPPGDSTSYEGRRECTVSGITCQEWESQTPHAHSYVSLDLFPDHNGKRLIVYLHFSLIFYYIRNREIHVHTVQEQGNTCSQCTGIGKYMFTMYRNRKIHVDNVHEQGNTCSQCTGIGKYIFTMYRNREIHLHNVQEQGNTCSQCT